MDAQQDADKQLAATHTAIETATAKLRLVNAQYNQLKTATDNLQVRHDNLRDYELRAWKILKDKDRELIQREATISFNDSTLDNQRSFLPKL